MINQIQELYETRCNIPSDINEHLPLLKSLAQQVEHITEMGVRSANSSTAFLCGEPKKLICYDLNSSIEIEELIKLSKNTNTEMEFYKKNVLEIEIEQTDLLFIDTFHMYEQVKQELLLHSNKVNKLIVLHDTTSFSDIGEDYKGLGLWYGIFEFLYHNPEWQVLYRVHNNSGLTIIQKLPQYINIITKIG